MKTILKTIIFFMILPLAWVYLRLYRIWEKDNISFDRELKIKLLDPEFKKGFDKASLEIDKMINISDSDVDCSNENTE
jgi:hypothetical protein